MKTFYLVNEELSFLEALVLTGVASVPGGIRMLTSRNLDAHDWSDAEFGASVSGGDLRLTFARPLNDLHIRIDLAGEVPESIACALHPSPAMTPDQVAAHLRGRRIIFLGCARDCADHIEDAIAALANLGRGFKDHRIAVFENDSKDATQAKLSRLARRGVLTLLQDSGLDGRFPQRTARIAHARNELLQWARAQGTADYLCVADLDGVVGARLDGAGFFSNFALEGVWDGVFPVNDDFYYDVYAVRQKDLAPQDFTQEMRRVDASLGKRLARWLQGYAKQLDLRAMEGWLPVESAFGGMGLYKYQALIGQRYVGLDANNQEVCEHVGVNAAIARSGGRLFINPRFVVAPGIDRDLSGIDVPRGIWSSRYLQGKAAE